MMLDIDFAEFRAGFVRYLPIGLALAVLLVVEIVFYGFAVWQTDSMQLARRVAPTPESVPNIQAIGALLSTRYLFVFEAAGLVLLVAMLGAIVLTPPQRGATRPQHTHPQKARRRGDPEPQRHHPP